ncbi:MAG TPA: GNAT family protein [Acidimicrobiales bacterium]|nr:GNAT family protein [Acidimicrobiales bacterium]
MSKPQEIVVRPSTPADFDSWFALFEAVAAEGTWIGRESPLDQEDRRQAFRRLLESDEAVTLVAESDDQFVGVLGMEVRHGLAEFGMMVDARWRGRGVGAALVQGAIAWASEHGAHKIFLVVWPHNAAARALYKKFGFEQEGTFRRHYRRRNGELWDAIQMGLVLDRESPGSPYEH